MGLRWVRDATGIGATSVLLTLRLLLAAEQDGVPHPLDHPLVARLTPNYTAPWETDEPAESFYLVNDVEVPLHALRQFGVDVFADHRFDAWVLFNIAQRQYNNVCGDSISGSLMPLFSLFNRSCEPNVEWSRMRENVAESRDSSGEEDDDDDNFSPVDHGTVTVTTARAIRKGEQLFVEYDGFEHEKCVAERWRRLRKWLAGDCMCTRCVREAAVEESGKVEDGERKDSVAESRGWDDGVEGPLPEERGQLVGMKLHHW